MSTPHDLHAEADKVDSIASRLHELASAFYLTGNDSLAERLDEMSDALTKSAQAVRREDCRISGERLRDAQQATANMLNAALVIAEKNEAGLWRKVEEGDLARARQALDAAVGARNVPRFRATMTRVPSDNCIPSIKAVREVTHFDLKEARDFVDRVRAGDPLLVLESMDRVQFERDVAILRMSGATIEVA